jgi:hypothetical protein
MKQQTILLQIRRSMLKKQGPAYYDHLCKITYTNYDLIIFKEIKSKI